MTISTPLVTGTDFITISTRDFGAAAEFYGSVLGLPLSKRWGQRRALAIHHRYAPSAPAG